MTTWVLLRGLAREARHWGDFGQQLRQRLPVGHAVVALDLPGNGTRWRERSPMNVDALVEAARCELGARPHEPPLVLVALSLGAMVALRWATLERRRVRGCVLINSSVGGLSPFWQRLRPGSYGALLGILCPGQSALEREERVLRLTSNLRAPARTVVGWANYAASAPVSRSNVLRQLVAAARFRAPRTPPAVATLLLASRHDRLVNVECSRRMAAAWRVPLREHADAGHDLPMDDPAWVIQQIVSWAETKPA